MTDKTRPPGLGIVTEEGLKLGARLAVGLLAVPLMGLSLFAQRKLPSAADPVPAPAATAESGPGPEADATTGTAPASPSDGPAQAEVETALRKLTDATFAKAGAAKKAAKPPSSKLPKSGRGKTKRPPAADPLSPSDARRSP